MFGAARFHGRAAPNIYSKRFLSPQRRQHGDDLLFAGHGAPEEEGVLLGGDRKGLLGREDDYVIPWGCIARIGGDIILVDAKGDFQRRKRRRHGFG